jgi:hypothetical protein
MWRHAFEMTQLIGTKAQHVTNARIDGSHASGNQWREDAVELGFLTQDAGGQLMGQASVNIGQGSQAAFERQVEWHAAAHGKEDPQGRAARRESGVVQPSIPATGEEGTATSRRGIRPAR